MHWRRAALLLGLALLAAVAQALVQHDDPRVGFQAWMVVQLLGVIAAAIGVAAAFSVMGLALVRLLTWPVRDRPSVFVAWSFLKAQVLTDPLPLRLWRWLRSAVDADPLQPPVLARWRVALLGLALLAGGLALAGQAVGWGEGANRVDLLTLVWRNGGLVVAFQGLLLLLASLPWRPLRSMGVALLLLAALAGVTLALHHPRLRPFVNAFAVAGALLLGMAVIVVAMRTDRRRRARLARRLGWVLMPLSVAVLVIGLGLLSSTPAWAVGLLSAGGVGLLMAAWMILQAQPKVTLPVFVSIVGVAAGTWALIVVLSVMGGFADDLRAKMLVANAHALVERPGRVGAIGDAAVVARTLRQVPGVIGVSPQVRGDAILSSTFNVHNFVAVRGIDPDLLEVQRELGGTVVSGSLALLSRPEALGRSGWFGRRLEEAPSDLPPTPPPSAVTVDQDAAAELEAMLQLAPGPAQPPPPAPPVVEPEMILLPSDGEPILRQGKELPVEGADSGDEAEELDERMIDTLDDPAPGLEPPMDSGSSAALRASLGLGLGGDLEMDVDVPVAPGILLGVELARSLQVDLGDRIEVITPDADIGPTGMVPRVRTFRVAGTFETGLYEADSKVAYVALAEASRYFNVDGAANVLELRLAAPEQPDAVVAAVRSALKKVGAPPDTDVIDWRALNRSLFSALAFERLVVFLVLALIILVASFSIVSALTMVILQKRGGIAMLQAMGAGRQTVRSAFVQMGAVIGMIGTTAGLILGLGTCLVVRFAGIQLPEAYYVRTLPVAISPVEITAVVAAALAISLVATVFPAKSAARLSPLEGLRYE